MFNIITVQNGLVPLVGFGQRVAKKTDRLDKDLTKSIAGSFIDTAAHPLLTLENIMLCVELFRNNDVAAWDAETEFEVNDVILYSSKVYYCIKAATNQLPDAADSEYWKLTNLLSAYLRNVRVKAASNLFESVFSERKLFNVGKTLLSDTSLHDSTGSLSNVVTNYGRFVCYIVRPKYKDTVISISSIGLQLNKPAPDFKFYVYQNASNTPLEELQIDHTSETTFQWHELEAGIELPHNSNVIDDNGVFFIGYYQSDLPDGCAAIWKEMFWNGECGACNTYNDVLFRRWNNFLDIQPAYVENTWLNDDRTMFDMSKAQNVKNQNWGMNFKIQVRCDVSDFIVRSKMAFVKGLKTQIVHDLLNTMAYSVRYNGGKEEIAKLAAYALEKADNGDPGYIKRLSDEVKNVNFDISDMNTVCLPCMKASSGAKTKSLVK